MKFHHALTDATIKAAKAQEKMYRLSDGGGLYLQVMPKGGMYWRYNYRFEGVQKTLAIGTYPIMPLKVARQRHMKAALDLQTGVDPAAEKREAKEEQKGQTTFREVAEQWLTTMVPEEKRSEKTAARDKRMVRYLNAEIGDLAVVDLEVRHLSDVLVQYEEAGKFETRVRVQGAAIAIMGFAVGRGYVKVNPFVGVNYTAAFTAPAEEPRPAITAPEAFGHLLRKVDLFEGRDDNMTGMALDLLALTFVRPGDVAKAEWAHFNLSDNPMLAKWSVPPDQAKMRTLRKKNKSERAGKPHEVPLSRQTVALLRRLQRLTGHSKYLFPGRQKARTMSENTMRDALISLGYKDIHCPHGFRSSASTLLNEERITVEGRKVLRWPEQAALIEVQLDHEDDSTRAIYNRGGRWEDSVELMQVWADRIDELRGAPARKLHLVVAA